MHVRRFLAAVAAGLFAVLMQACAPLAPPPGGIAPAPPGFPDEDYRRAAAAGEAVFHIDAARSLALVEVRRGGSLAFLGHDHVVASHGLQGYVLPAAGRADLYLRLDELVVDEAELRAAAGFDTSPTAEDIAATRSNMLDKVLHAGTHPHLWLRVERVRAVAEGVVLDTIITLNGVTRRLEVPARLDGTADVIRISGRFTLSQRDFGIEPFSVFGGALQVQDALALQFRIEARQLAP